jgi:hypothetical protein
MLIYGFETLALLVSLPTSLGPGALCVCPRLVSGSKAQRTDCGQCFSPGLEARGRRLKHGEWSRSNGTEHCIYARREAFHDEHLG